MKFKGINPIKAEGSGHQTGFGYSKFVKLKIQNQTFTPILIAKISPFGIKEWKDQTKENIFGRVEDEQDSLSFYVKSSNPKINGFILGISTIILGEDIWGPQTGFELGQVKNYRKIAISTQWDFKVKNGFANFVYDLWLNKNRRGECVEQDIEIMIWLDYNFETPWEEVGELEEFKVKYIQKKKEEHPYDLGHTFAFFLKNKRGQIDLDYKKIINFCGQYLKRDLSKYWIRSIYLGTEFSKSTTVDVKLYQAHFSFG